MTEFYVTRDDAGWVYISCNPRTRKDGQSYARDRITTVCEIGFRRVTGLKLESGERKCVELVEVRRPSR